MMYNFNSCFVIFLIKYLKLILSINVHLLVLYLKFIHLLIIFFVVRDFFSFSYIIL